ncbi:MAG TPA: dCTP deaminase [Patescibacteria group bacterium]|nr:dCTP deaminase [Patescibacteria group bacterium]
MILSDVDIQKEIKSKRLKISPFDSKAIQPASLDVKMDNEFRIFKNSRKPFLDVKEPADDFMELIKVKNGDPIIIHPREFLLGTTIEKVTIPDDLVAQLNGRSSLGRLGIIVHATAGFIDPGFSGFITLEITNVATLPIALYPGMRIGQLSFTRLSTPAKNPYGPKKGSKYSGQVGPTTSKIWKDFTKDKKK